MKKDFFVLIILAIILIILYFVLKKTNEEKTIIYYSSENEQKEEKSLVYNSSNQTIKLEDLQVEVKDNSFLDTQNNNIIIVPFDSLNSITPSFSYKKKDIIKNPVFAETVFLIISGKKIPVSLISPYSIHNVILAETSKLPKENFPLKIEISQKFTPVLTLFLEKKKEESYQVLIPQGIWTLPWYKKDSFVIINPLETTTLLKVKVFKNFYFLKEEKILINYQMAINDFLQPLLNERGYYEIFIESPKTLTVLVKELKKNKTNKISNYSALYCSSLPADEEEINNNEEKKKNEKKEVKVKNYNSYKKDYYDAFYENQRVFEDAQYQFQNFMNTPQRFLDQNFYNSYPINCLKNKGYYYGPLQEPRTSSGTQNYPSKKR